MAVIENRSIADGDETAGEERKRQTFLEVREILKRVLDSLREIRRRLERVPVRDERTRMFVDTLVRQRRELERAIDRNMLDVPVEILDGFVQYGVDPSIEGIVPPGGPSPEELAKWQTGCDGALSGTLLDLSTRLQNPEAKELVESIVSLFGAHDRRVSLALQELRDV